MSKRERYAKSTYVSASQWDREQTEDTESDARSTVGEQAVFYYFAWHYIIYLTAHLTCKRALGLGTQLRDSPCWVFQFQEWCRLILLVQKIQQKQIPGLHPLQLSCQVHIINRIIWTWYHSFDTNWMRHFEHPDEPWWASFPTALAHAHTIAKLNKSSSSHRSSFGQSHWQSPLWVKLNESRTPGNNKIY